MVNREPFRENIDYNNLHPDYKLEKISKKRYAGSPQESEYYKKKAIKHRKAHNSSKNESCPNTARQEERRDNMLIQEKFIGEAP